MSKSIGRTLAFSALLAAVLIPVPAQQAVASKAPKKHVVPRAYADSVIHHIQVPGGAELSYVDHGTGETVILVHPTALDMRAWYEQMDPLARRFRVIAYSRRYQYPNLPGGKEVDETIEAHVRDLGGLIRTLQLGQVRLMGHSEGGAIAAQFTFEHPELVKSLVLVDPTLPTVLAGTTSDSAYTAERRQALTMSAMALRDGFDDLGVERWVDWEYGDMSIVDMPNMVVQQLAQNIVVIRRRMAKAMSRSTIGMAEFAKIATPTLLVDGDKSPWYYKAMCDSLKSARPDAKLVTMKSIGHGMLWMRPNPFNKIVTEFMAPPPMAREGD